MRIIKFSEVFHRIKIEKDIKRYHFKRIYNQFQSFVHNFYLIIYCRSKGLKNCSIFSKSYIFKTYSNLFLLIIIISYTCTPSFQRNLDAKREVSLRTRLKTRFAYIRPTARFFFIGDTTFFFFFLLYLEIWIMIFGGDTIRDRTKLKAKIVASWNEQPLSPVKTGNRNSWLQRQPNSLGYYVAKIPFERS